MKTIKNLSLNGKTAIVTGAGQGLGKGFAITLAQAGADVAVVDIDYAKAKKASNEIEKMGRRSIAIEADISICEEASRMVEEVMKQWGKLTIAVNNVGISLKIKDAIEVTEQEWDRIIDTNLKGTFFCCQAEAKAMIREEYGKIINIASICGYIVWPEYQAVYSTSKAGIIHLTRCLAVEWIKHGIRVNSISPGVTRTPDLFPEVIDVFLKKAPVEHIAEVRDIQGALLFLASEMSDFVVGRDIVVDGGYTLL